MWIYYKKGFISVVQHKQAKDFFLVRSRSLEHLKSFAGHAAPIQITPTADYDYRCLMTKVVFAERLIEQVALIDYSNFKSSVTCKSYQALLMQLWLSTKLWF